MQLVRTFKDAVKVGLLDSEAIRRQLAEWEDYRREGSGRRKGRRRAEIDYISYHGGVVDLLIIERERSLAKGERILNSPLIDLYVRSGKAMTELYEVKTSVGRQSIYTGIGQRLAHSHKGDPGIRKILMLPEGQLPDGLEDCVTALGIVLRQYRLRTGAVPKLALL